MLPKLYGLEFTRSDIPKYHSDVETFEVQRNGKHVGILMIDGIHVLQRGVVHGVVHSGARANIKEDDIPYCNNGYNSTPPTDKPSLTSDELRHCSTNWCALHQLLSNRHTREFQVLLVHAILLNCLQIMEHCLEPEVLKVYAKHYQTGEIIPAEIVENLINQANSIRIYLLSTFSALDMDIML